MANSQNLRNRKRYQCTLQHVRCKTERKQNNRSSSSDSSSSNNSNSNGHVR